MTTVHRSRLDGRDLAPLGLGLVVLAGGSLFGWDARLVAAVVDPVPVVRAALIAAAAVSGALLLRAGVRRIRGSSIEGSADPDVRAMLRGIRVMFLALAAFAAGLGWLLAHPLPIVIALVIAGIDVIETTFLLLVVGRTGSRPAPD